MTDDPTMKSGLRRYARSLEDAAPPLPVEHVTQLAKSSDESRSAWLRGPRLAALTAVAVLVIGVAAFVGAAGVGSDSAGDVGAGTNADEPGDDPNDAAVLSAAFAESCTEAGDVYLDTLVSWPGVWYRLDAGQLDLRTIDTIGSYEIHPQVAEQATRLAVVDNDAGDEFPIVAGDLVRPALDAVQETQTTAIIKVTARDGERGFGFVSEVAMVDDQGEVDFAGTCGDRLYSDVLASFRDAFAPESSTEDVLVRLLTEPHLVPILSEHIFGPDESAWADRSPAVRSFLDPDVPQSAFDDIEAIDVQFSVPDEWQTSGNYLCTAVRDVASNECVRLELEGYAGLEALFPLGGGFDLVLVSADWSQRTVVGSFEPTADELSGGVVAVELVDSSVTPADALSRPRQAAELFART